MRKIEYMQCNQKSDTDPLSRWLKKYVLKIFSFTSAHDQITNYFSNLTSRLFWCKSSIVKILPRVYVPCFPFGEEVSPGFDAPVFIFVFLFISSVSNIIINWWRCARKVNTEKVQRNIDFPILSNWVMLLPTMSSIPKETGPLPLLLVKAEHDSTF